MRGCGPNIEYPKQNLYAGDAGSRSELFPEILASGGSPAMKETGSFDLVRPGPILE